MKKRGKARRALSVALALALTLSLMQGSGFSMAVYAEEATLSANGTTEATVLQTEEESTSEPTSEEENEVSTEVTTQTDFGEEDEDTAPADDEADTEPDVTEEEDLVETEPEETEETGTEETETEETETAETEVEETEAVELKIGEKTRIYRPDASALPDNDELFAAYVMRMLYGESGISLLGEYGGSTLSGIDREIYDQLKSAICEVAANGGSTHFEIDLELVDDITCEVVPGKDSGAELAAQIDDEGIFAALLADCPYELYWFDKLEGISMNTGYSEEPGTNLATLSNLDFDFYVAVAYQYAEAEDAGDDPMTWVDAGKATAATTAASNAQSVIEKNEGKTDYEKLVAYKDYICNAVSYNSDAAGEDYDGGYGDPWQLIYVFDGDSSTNVVCEGYAKAFQYLCDLGGLTCYTVTGTMTGGTGAGAHMWNIVTLDGKNYLVDVTNSDTGTVGQDGSLFLAGTSGSVADGYSFNCNGQTISFAYDSDTKSLYGDSILTLAAEDYTEPVTEANGVAKVVMEDGTTTYCKTITEAFAAVGKDDTATITLLRDAPVESGKITVSGDVTLVGGDHTISGTYSDYGISGLINIPSGAKMTITGGIFTNSSSAPSQIYTVYVDGGTLVIGGGTITATASTNDATAVWVYRGSAEISGGTFTGTAYGYRYGYGIYVTNNGSAKLTGGTFTGSYGAVRVALGNVGNLLETGYIYYKDGAYAAGDSDNLGSGIYTVVKCENHSWGAWSDAGDGTHTHACEYCGQTESKAHTYDTNGKCTAEGCTSQATASVTTGGATTFYGTIEDAWAAAKGKTATVTLLANAEVTAPLIVEAGDDITLTSADKADGGVYQIGVQQTGQLRVIWVNGGALKLEKGELHMNIIGKMGVYVSGGTFTMTGGTVSAMNGYALDVSGGSVQLSGGQLVRKYESGTNEVISITSTAGRTVGDLLAVGYGYKRGNDWVTDTTGTSMNGPTITVEKAPIQSVSVAADKDTVTYGAAAPTLTAKVELANESMAVSYQWYQDGVAIDGATGETYIPDKLDADDYAYTCTATADGYSLTSEAVTVTVNPVDISEAVVTLGVTAIEYNGMEREVTVSSVVLNGVALTRSSEWVYEDSELGTDVGTYTVTVAGTGNYFGTATATWEITPKELRVTDWAIEKAYDGTTDITLDAADAVMSGVCGNDDVKLDISGVTAQFDDAAVGNDKAITYSGMFTLAGNTAGNYTLAAQPTLTGTITKRQITVTPTAGLKIEYGQPMPKLTYTLSGDGLVSEADLTGALACDTGSGAVGVYSITQGTLAATENYELTFTTGVTFEITKPDLATATVTLDQSSFTYDGTAREPGITVVKDGVTVDSSEYDVTYSNTNGGDGNHTNAGTVTVTVTAKADGNYSGSQSATFEIKKGTPDPGTVGYTGTIFPATALEDIVLTRTDETVPGTLTLDAGQTLTVGEGTYTWTFTPDDTTNYNEVTGTVMLKVTKDSLTGISIGDTAPEKTDYVYEDAFDPTGLTVTATYASGNTAVVTDKVTFGVLAAGQTSIELSYTEDGVTETCTVTGITVAKKQLDVSGMSWNVGSYTYDGTAQGPALEGDLPAGVTATTAGASGTDAGNYTAKADFALAEGYSADNYEISGNNPLTKEWNIGKADTAITVSVESVTGSGDTRMVTLTASLTKSGEGAYPAGSVVFYQNEIKIGEAAIGSDGKASCEWQAAANTSYTVKASYGGGNNYNSAESAEITVDTSRMPQQIAIAAVGTKTYGDGPFTLALSEAGSGTGAVTFTSSDPDILKIEGNTAAICRAGEVTVTAVKAADDTYNEATADIVLVIAKKTLTIKADDKSVVAGGRMPALTFTAEGFVNGDSFKEAPVVETEAVDTKTVGKYAITVTGGTPDNEDCYDVKYVDGTLTVTAPSVDNSSDSTGSGSHNSGFEDSSTDSDSGSAGSGTTASRPAQNEAGSPTAAPTETVKPDSSGNAQIPAEAVNRAIIAAAQEAQRTGNAHNGIAVTVPVETKTGQPTLTVTLRAQTLDALVAGGVKNFLVQTDGMASISLDAGALQALDALTLGDIVLRVNRLERTAQNLSAEMRAAVGTGPVYDISLWQVLNGSETRIDTLGGQGISISIPYTPALTENTGMLFAVYMDGAGRARWLTQSCYDADRQAVIFKTVSFGVYGAGYPAAAVAFTDISGHWAAEHILFAACRGLLAGVSETAFAPDAPLTRGMLAVALGRLAGVDPALYSANSFTDVAAQADYTPYVNWAAQTGIMSGSGRNTFLPEGTVTRGQLAVILKNYAEKTGISLPAAIKAVTFADNAQILTGERAAVQAVQQAGVLLGKTGNRFDPQGLVTRAEAAAALHRYVAVTIDPQTANGLTQNDSGEWYFYKDGEPVLGWLPAEQKWYWLG